jgi:hypothetical protein
MTDSDLTDTAQVRNLTLLHRFEAETKVRNMTKPEKIAYLKSNGWRHAGNNRWEHRSTGMTLPFGAAVLEAVLRDITKP